MSIAGYVEQLKAAGEFEEFSLSLYGRFTFRVRYRTSGLPKQIECLMWPFAWQGPADKPLHTIYALVGAVPREDIKAYQLAQNALMRSKEAVGSSDLLLITPPFLDFLTGGQTISYRFKKEVFALNPDAGRLAEDVSRTLQQLLVFHFEKEGAYLFHASAVEANRGALLFIGECGSGKTTFSLAAAKAGARLITNDQAVVKKTDTGFSVQGWPEGVNLFRADKAPKQMVPLIKQFDGARERLKTDETLLKYIAFPRISAESCDLKCEKLSGDTGNALLSEGLKTYCDFERPPWPGLGEGCRFFSVQCSYAQADRAVEKLMTLIGEEGT